MANLIAKRVARCFNVYYLIIGIVLMGVGGAALGTSKLSSVAVAGGIIACGVLLFLVSVFGLIAARGDGYPSLLLIYSVVMLILFIIQAAISAALLAVPVEHQITILETAWANMNVESKLQVQDAAKCCGFTTVEKNDTVMGPPPGSLCTAGQPPCLEHFLNNYDQAFKMAGAVGLFFCSHYLPAPVISLYLRKRILKAAVESKHKLREQTAGAFDESDDDNKKKKPARGSDLKAIAAQATLDEQDEEEEEEEESDDAPPAKGAKPAIVARPAPAAAAPRPASAGGRSTPAKR